MSDTFSREYWPIWAKALLIDECIGRPVSIRIQHPY